MSAYKEGYDAYLKREGIDSNPYDWSDKTWEMVEDWEDGWYQAQKDDQDDD